MRTRPPTRLVFKRTEKALRQAEHKVEDAEHRVSNGTRLTPTTGVVSRTVKVNRTAVDRGVDWAPGIPSTASAVCAIAGGISAAHAPVAPERTYGKEKVGSALGA